jgi:hypothetical protein
MVWISRKKYNRLLRRLVLAEQVADAAVDRDEYGETKEERLEREVKELRYSVDKRLRALNGETKL